METTAGIFRGHVESWRSSPVRWLLERVGQLTRFTDPSGPVPVVQDRWQEMFWTESGRSHNSAAARSRSSRFEQAELWDASPAAASRPAAPVTRPAAPVVTTASQAAASVRVKPASRSAARRVAGGSIYADRGRQVQTEDIARYLQVNNAVYGRLVPVADLALPRRSFNAELQLWKGSEIGTPFVTGC